MRKLSKSDITIIAMKEHGYTVNKDQVISPKGRTLKQQLSDSGYYRIRAVFNNNKRLINVHRIIAYFKYGDEIFKHDCVRHKNEISTDNSPDNLLLGSHHDNAMDRDKKTRIAHAKKAARHVRKLSDEEVKNLRKDRKEGMTYKQLMSKYNLAKSTVSYIVNNITYEE
jgi:hypothetical protein